MFKNFISSQQLYCTFDEPVSAPYFRKSFDVNEKLNQAALRITAKGFYRAYLNGKEVTPSVLAPYISNPDQILYYDEINILDKLKKGRNVLGILLGNGFANSQDNNLWDFEKAAFRSAPMAAFEISLNGKIVAESDMSVKTHPSPIIFDDLRCGEHYDANLEIENWNLSTFDDSMWRDVVIASRPNCEIKLNNINPVAIQKVLNVQNIMESEEGYLFDFGENNAGVVRLCCSGSKGQKVVLVHGEIVNDNKLDIKNIAFGDKNRKGFIQQDEYTFKGVGVETYMPSFTYHGFRYVLVKGLKKQQISENILQFIVFNTEKLQTGDFYSDNEMINKIQRCVQLSDQANFVHIPTDCPQREKNGWTGDVVLSMEQFSYNFDYRKNLKQWYENVLLAMDENGKIPGIVPTGGWGYVWGNGPCWDAVLVEVPYYIYKFYGESDIIDCDKLYRYIKYLETRINERGLIAFGLGDWCQVAKISEDGYDTSNEITDTIMAINIINKAVALFQIKGRDDGICELTELRERLYNRFRELYIKDGLIDANTQTAHAFGLYYGIYQHGEKAKAYHFLKKLILQKGYADVGVLGGRVIYDVLAENGDAELAVQLMIKPAFPSYAYWINRGATTLWEAFHELTDDASGLYRKDGIDRMLSLNHHFWGFVSTIFYKYLAGITVVSCDHVDIKPSFVSQLSHVKSHITLPGGKISVEWSKEGDFINLIIDSPKEICGKIKLAETYCFDNGLTQKELAKGAYIVKKAE